ncbi:MAG: TSUP family transporter [Acidobacteria bacterium]|nr:TSUP family transporter [Acidobacteriota bacterium]
MPWQTLILTLSLGGGAFLFSMYGQGGGGLYAPVQLLFGTDFQLAAARSQLYIVLTAISATLVYRRAGRIDWGLAAALEVTASVGAFAGSRLAGLFPALWLEILLGVTVLLAAVTMLMEPPTWNFDDNDERLWLWRREVSGRSYTANMLIGLPAAALIGVLSGLTGTAGGFLKTPLLIMVFGMPADLACGTTAFMVSVTAAAGFLGRAEVLAGDLPTSILLGVAVFLGAQIGPRVALRTDPAKLQRWFSLLLGAVGSATLIRALW